MTQAQICTELMYNVRGRLEDVDYREAKPQRHVGYVIATAVESTTNNHAWSAHAQNIKLKPNALSVPEILLTQHGP